MGKQARRFDTDAAGRLSFAASDFVQIHAITAVPGVGKDPDLPRAVQNGGHGNFPAALEPFEVVEPEFGRKFVPDRSVGQQKLAGEPIRLLFGRLVREGFPMEQGVAEFVRKGKMTAVGRKGGVVVEGDEDQVFRRMAQKESVKEVRAEIERQNDDAVAVERIDEVFDRPFAEIPKSAQLVRNFLGRTIVPRDDVWTHGARAAERGGVHRPKPGFGFDAFAGGRRERTALPMKNEPVREVLRGLFEERPGVSRLGAQLRHHFFRGHDRAAFILAPNGLPDAEPTGEIFLRLARLLADKAEKGRLEGRHGAGDEGWKRGG